MTARASGLVGRLLLVVAASATLVATFLAGEGTAAPAVTASPNTALHDLQVVQIAGTEYPPNASVTISQCQLFGNAPGGVCYGATRTVVTTDATGAFSTPFVVRRVIVEATSSVDCATAACGIAAGPAGPVLVAPLTFDAAVPPAQPIVSVAPATDLTDSVVVHVSGAGFSPDRAVTVTQCRAGGVGLAGCDTTLNLPVTTDAAGAFAVDFVVHAAITATGTDGGPVDCLVDPGCAIVAANTAGPSEFAAAPIAFQGAEDALPRTGANPRVLVGVACSALLLGAATVRRRPRVRA
jgi:hypothetical protein